MPTRTPHRSRARSRLPETNHFGPGTTTLGTGHPDPPAPADVISLGDWQLSNEPPPGWSLAITELGGGVYHTPTGLYLHDAAGTHLYCTLHDRTGSLVGIALGTERRCRLSTRPRHLVFPTLPALGSLTAPETALASLINALRRRGAAEVEFSTYDTAWVPVADEAAIDEELRQEYVVHLRGSAEEQVQSFGTTHRRHVSRGRREGWTLEQINGDRAIEILREVTEVTAERSQSLGRRYSLGLPIDEINRASSPDEGGRLTTFAAYQNGTLLSAALIGQAGRRAYLITGGSTRTGYQRNSSTWLYWQIMAELIEAGYRSFNLGGSPGSPLTASEPDDPHHGLYRFKMGLGAEVVRSRNSRHELDPGHLRLHRIMGRLNRPDTVVEGGDRPQSRRGERAMSLIRTVRSQPIFYPVALIEARSEIDGAHTVDQSHRPHLVEAIDWLVRAQDATPDDGVARGYSLTWNSYFRARGWQASYPETTGYIIPTLYKAALFLDRPELIERADRAAYWLVEGQLPSGAVRGGVIGQRISPSVFNTGQVILGWLNALARTGDETFARAITRAGNFLVSAQGSDGHWRRGSSAFANAWATEYNTRVAWALAEAGTVLDEPGFLDTAARNLHAVRAAQSPNGWFSQCCLDRPDRPLLHTLAYTIRGLLEGGRVLEDDELIRSAELAARHLLDAVHPGGSMPGRFRSDWSMGAEWSCLTGQAQMANNWMRLAEVRDDPSWLAAVPATLRFLKSTQNRTSRDPGLRGGIKGSFPVGGDYAPYEVLNWATKFFADALMRAERIEAPNERPYTSTFQLA